MVSLMSRRPIIPAELKHGPFTVAEALQTGLTRKQLRGRSWRRLSTGLYAWARIACVPAVILAAVGRRLPAGAAFSDRTAAWLHRLDLPPCDPVEVTIPHGCRVSARAGVCVRRCDVPEPDVVQRQGLPVTSPLRTVLDLSRRLPLTEAVVAVDMALHRGLVDLVGLRAYVAANPRRRGIAQARRATELADAAAESPMESRLRMLLILAGLPRPEVQVPLHDDRGRFIGRPDLYYRAQRIGHEFDGLNTSRQPRRRQPPPEPPAERRIPASPLHLGRRLQQPGQDHRAGGVSPRERTGPSAGDWPIRLLPIGPPAGGWTCQRLLSGTPYANRNQST